MATTITVPKEYGYVLLVSGVCLPLLSATHQVVCGRMRRRAGVPYPNHYATIEQAKSSDDAYAFNCAQRAHSQFGEHLPHTLILVLVAGLRFPVAAAMAGAVWGLFRGLFLWGYINDGRGGGGKRRLIGQPYLYTEIGLLGMSAATVWGVLNGGW